MVVLCLFTNTTLIEGNWKMDRITTKHLDGLVDKINRITGSPLTPYLQSGNNYTPQALNYHLDWAYGGVCLVRMCKTGSGVTSISQIGFATKRALYQWMSAYIDGLGAK